MRLDFKFIVALATVLVLVSCAQVGRVTGGDKDVHAPAPVWEKSSPQNESLNFDGNKIELVFDEYFKLKNPTSQITIVPNHASLKAEINKKTLTIRWDDTLKNNTTYAIYFNKAIADITEGNDSIMQFVFSTGPKLDTLQYELTLIDAWTSTAMNKCVVALYDKNTNEVVNFSQSNSNGRAKLQYIPEGEYKLLAFNDDNQDLIPQESEAIGFPDNPIVQITENQKDTVPVRLFNQKEVPSSQASILSKTKISLKGQGELIDATFILNDTIVPDNEVRSVTDDSTVLMISNSLLAKNTLIVQAKSFVDTINLRHNTRGGNKVVASFKCNANSCVFNPAEDLLFESSMAIQILDTSKIQVVNLSDSSWMSGFDLNINLDLLKINLDNRTPGNYQLVFKPGALQRGDGLNKEITLPFTINDDRNYGTINLDVTAYDKPIVVYTKLRNKVVRTTHIQSTKDIIDLKYLLPGAYSFKVVVDENNNGKWDVGDINSYQQPEPVHFFNKATKLRANWESKVTLTP